MLGLVVEEGSFTSTEELVFVDFVPINSLRVVAVEYDFEKKFYRISMFDDTRVKIKLIK